MSAVRHWSREPRSQRARLRIVAGLRRPAGRRRPIGSAFAALAALGTVLALTFANAAALPLTGGSLASTTATHPCLGSATATATTGSGTTYSAVSVTVPDGCAGRELKVTLLNGTTELGSGTGTVAGSGATVVTFTGTYTAAAGLTVRAVVDGWDLPATWSFTPPAPTLPATCVITNDVSGWGSVNGVWSPILVPPQDPGGCTVTGVAVGSSWSVGDAQVTQYTVTFRNDTPRQVEWQGTLDFSVSPFHGWTPQAINGLGTPTTDGWNARTTSACTLLPRVEIVGNPSSTRFLGAGGSLSVGFQVASAPVADWSLNCGS